MTTAPGLDAAPMKPHPFWMRELPFSLVLIAAVLGIAYTSISKTAIVLYWEVLAPAIWLVCIASGWHSAQDRAARVRLLATQTAHWVSFLIVMNLLLLPGVQKLFNANATGLAVFILLTLGTFTAGVHASRPPPILLQCMSPKLALLSRAGRPTSCRLWGALLPRLLIAGAAVRDPKRHFGTLN